MNRRMIRAKAARKWHAMQARIIQRHWNGISGRIVDTMAETIAGNRRFGDAARECAKAITDYAASMVAAKLAARAMAELRNAPRYHVGGFARGPAKLRTGEVPAVLSPGVTLAPGRLLMRPSGSDQPMREVGTTGPITVTVQPRSRPVFCGVCGQPITTDHALGTRCACVLRPVD